MFVVSEDGKKIVDAISFTVARNLGGKSGKYAVVAQSAITGSLDSSAVISSWPDEESAKEELQRIWQALQEGSTCYATGKSL